MTDPKYIEDGADEGIDEEELSHTSMADAADKALWAEIERRYGRLEDKAADIARAIFEDTFSNRQTEDVFQLLKKMAPEVYKAEADFARRYEWAMRAKENGGRAPKLKAKVTNHELGADPNLDVKNYKQVQLSGQPKGKKDKNPGIWKHVNFNNSHNRRVSYVDKNEEGDIVRVVSREMLRAMEPFLIDFAQKHGIRGSKQFRSYGYDDGENHPREKGDDKKNLESLPPMKRLMLLTAQAFCDQFRAKDFF